MKVVVDLGIALLSALVLWPILAIIFILCNAPQTMHTVELAYIITAGLLFLFIATGK